MCGGFPNSKTGEPAPRMTIWEALIEIWRGGRWYADTRPLREGQ